MATRTPRIPDAALAKIPGKALYNMATQGAEVVVGGDHPTLVLPEAHASKWGGECWLRVRHADADEIDRADKAAKSQGKALKTTEKASLRTDKGKPVLDIPTPGKGRRHEIREGSLKWDVVYEDSSALPVDGIERFQLEFPEGLTWHYQPELTPEEIAEGAERPENVIGSYAGYFDKTNRILDANGEEIANYETGKFAHLYRPEMVDAAGNRCWASQEIAGNELRVTLPTEWLATAVYPVRLDPVFGYESLGASTNGMYGNRIYPSMVGAPTSAGTITAFTMGMNYFNNATPEVALCGIYNISSGFPSAPLVGYSQVVASTDPSSATKKWYAFPAVGSPEVVADGVYALCGSVGPDTTLIAYQLYDTVTGYTSYYYSRAYDGTLPSPFPGTPSVQGNNRMVSIYATYTESGGGGTTSSADPGNIAISGSAATGVKSSVASADSGTVSISGSVASGLRSLVSMAAAASIAIAGFAAEGVYTPTGSTVSSAGPGIVAISGASATGVQTHITSADPGTIAITGSNANAATGYASSADAGTVAITGTDATASRTYVATASPTAIAITGSPAYATKSGGSSTSSGISLIFGKVILHL